MVQQDGSLLHRTLRENITYGNPNANEDQIISAAKKAEAHDFIIRLEDSEGNKGCDACVGKRGIKLSGGQRQRVALAGDLERPAHFNLGRFDKCARFKVRSFNSRNSL